MITRPRKEAGHNSYGINPFFSVYAQKWLAVNLALVVAALCGDTSVIV